MLSVHVENLKRNTLHVVINLHPVTVCINGHLVAIQWTIEDVIYLQRLSAKKNKKNSEDRLTQSFQVGI